MSRSASRRFLSVLALVLLPAAVVGAENLPRGGANAPGFEVDGDMVAADGGSLDWDDPLVPPETDEGVIVAARNPDGSCTQVGHVTLGTPGRKGTGALVCDGSVGGAADRDVFGAGGDKEEEGPVPVGWTIQPAPPSVPKKADLSEVAVYAAVGDSAFDVDQGGPVRADDLFMVMAMTRLDVNGDSHVDFEYNQAPLAAAGSDACPQATSGSSCQVRVEGDLIFAFDLAAGATTPESRVFQFHHRPAPGEACAATQADRAAGCYVQIPIPTTAAGDPSVRAVLNAAEIDAPSWGTVGCEPVTGDSQSGCRPRSRIPARGNLEAYVDVSAFVHHDLALCPGFAQLTTKTRSSSSISASLTDMAAPVVLQTAACGSMLVATVDRRGQPLAGTGVQLDPDPFTREAGATRTIDDGGPDDRAVGANGHICIDGIRFNDYRLTQAVIPAGYFADPTTAPVAALSPSSCAERLTIDGHPLPGATIDATYTNPQGAFTIRNQTSDGLPVGGTTFTVRPDPHTHQPGTSLNVADSDGDGLTCVEDVYADPANRDTNQPTPYDIAPTTIPKSTTITPTLQTVAITEPGTCATENPENPDAAFTTTQKGKSSTP